MPFFMPEQENDFWCWAAVTVCIEACMPPQRLRSQCSVATLVRGGDCCARPAPCHRAARLTDALHRVGRVYTRLQGTLRFGQIRTEIDAGRPVAVRIGWYGGGGHFVVIHGYFRTLSGVPLVDVADPLFPSGRWNYDDFCSAYQNGEVGSGGGRWTHTYVLSP